MRAACILLFVLLAVTQLRAQTSTVIVQMIVSPSTVVVGQPVVVSIQALDPNRSVGLRLLPPLFSDFGQDPPDEPSTSLEVINGIPYTVYRQQITIYPNRSGTFIIEPTQAQIPETPLTPEQIFASSAAVLNVIPLPQPTPNGYTNAVGELAVTAQIDQTAIPSTGSLTAALVISGEGNLAMIRPPQFDAAQDWWRVLPPRRVLSADRKRLVFEWTLLPLRSGLLPVALPAFAWYDPTAGYKSIESSQITVTVGPGLNNSPTPNTTAVPIATQTSFHDVTILFDTADESLEAIVPRLWPENIVLWLLPLGCTLVVLVIVTATKRPLRTPSRRAVANSDQLRSDILSAVQQPPARAFPLLEGIFRRELRKHQNSDEEWEVWLQSLPEPLRMRVTDLLQSLADAKFAPASRDDVRAHAQAVIRVLRQLETFSEQL